MAGGPDGQAIIYASNRAGTQYDIVSKPADGDGRENTVLSRPLTQIPRAAGTGHRLMFEETSADRPNALWLMSLREPGTPRPLFEPPMGEMMPTFSPEGRWVAYVSPHVTYTSVYGQRWRIRSNQLVPERQ